MAYRGMSASPTWARPAVIGTRGRAPCQVAAKENAWRALPSAPGAENSTTNDDYRARRNTIQPPPSISVAAAAAIGMTPAAGTGVVPVDVGEAV